MSYHDNRRVLLWMHDHADTQAKRIGGDVPISRVCIGVSYKRLGHLTGIGEKRARTALLSLRIQELITRGMAGPGYYYNLTELGLTTAERLNPAPEVISIGFKFE